jgi:hypothetical protein
LKIRFALISKLEIKFPLLLFLVLNLSLHSEKTVSLKSHKDLTEELFEDSFEKHGHDSSMFKLPLSNIFSKKKESIEEKKFQELLDRVEKLEKDLLEEKNRNRKKSVQLAEPKTIQKEDWEIQLEKDLEKQKNKTQSTNTNAQADTTADADWEAQLEKDLKAQKSQTKKFENSRGVNSPTQLNPLTGDRNTQNLMMDINAAVDMVGAWDKNKTKTTKNSFDVREAEFGFNAAVDQWLRGTLLIAAHNEDGKFFFEIHEAKVMFPFIHKYVSITAGRMFMDLGRLNRIHRHDRPFTQTPTVHAKLLGEEAAQDTGTEINFLAPWKWITQELVVGATNGRTWGHTHTEGQNKSKPHLYFHQKNFYYLGNNAGIQFGFTGSRYEPEVKDKKIVRRQSGFDLVVKWNRSFLRAFSLMSEFWLRETEYPYSLTTNNKPDSEHFFGYYIFGDYLFHQQWSAGFRYDYFTVKNLKDKNGFKADNAIISYTPQITFKPSEYSFIRGSFERRLTQDFTIEGSTLDFRPADIQFQDYVQNIGKEKSQPITISYQFYIQCTFILGSHPAHVY